MFAESEKRQQEAVYGTTTCFLAIVAVGMLTQSILVISFLVFLVSLPVWLPYLIVRIRYIIFERINGEEGVQIPSDKYDDKVFTYLYNHPAVNLRSKQNNVGLSDFFWYLLGPAHFIHQEHLESDTEKYKILKQVTTNIISKPQTDLIKMIEKYIEPLFDEIVKTKRPKIVHLRHFFFTAFLKIFYELTFGEEIKDEKQIKIIYDSANDVITALKFVKIRNMKARHKFTEYLYDKLTKENNETINKHFKSDINKHVTDRERALYLQGVVFTTGTVQISEALAHLCVTLAQHSYGNNKMNLDAFISEMFRVYPLFGIAHRITSEDIKLPDSDEILPKGTVLCFNYPEFHRRGYRRASTFNYKRWNHINKKTANFIPFGAKANRPCPAQHISMVWLKKCAQMMVDKVEFHTSILHTRSMPDGGLCLIVPKSYYGDDKKVFSDTIYCKAIMTSFWLYEQFTNVIRSIIQLFCGAYMLQDAKTKKLAKTWVEENEKKNEKIKGKTMQTIFK